MFGPHFALYRNLLAPFFTVAESPHDVQVTCTPFCLRAHRVDVAYGRRVQGFTLRSGRRRNRPDLDAYEIDLGPKCSNGRSDDGDHRAAVWKSASAIACRHLGPRAET